jgi:hypothetical protein
VFEIVHAESPVLGLLASDAPSSLRRKEKRTLDSEIERLARQGVISTEAALAYALDPGPLAKKLGPTDSSRLR